MKSREGELRVMVDGVSLGKRFRDERWKEWEDTGRTERRLGAEICEAEKETREGGRRLGAVGEVKLGEREKLWSVGELMGDQAALRGSF